MEGIVNTGNGSVVWGLGEPVAKIAFDEVVDLATNGGERRVRLLKLDCEGRMADRADVAEAPPDRRDRRGVS